MSYDMAGGPLKPSVGLSGVVPLLETAFRLLVHVFLHSTRTQRLRALHSRLRTAENYSTASLQDAHTTRASPDCDECSGAFLRIADDSAR